MELKAERDIIFQVFSECFNRTFMELKAAINALLA